ncbi:uncharacterized protein LOC123533917 [Mercenaria mercenaria]|uniref:uncharacterized protein LOC123533917 n=1 Tax=Mercenaria mercenaria TaxID=6596 RepID=UPI00234F8C97|nr:uncharacterized protein LOC123533917 [Mercenaria mercenaria]
MKTEAVLFLIFLTGISSRPRRFLDCDDFDCSDPVSPVCGSNGQTYASQCEMDMENKRRVCWIGHYNMIMKVRDGPCDSTTTATVA